MTVGTAGSASPQSVLQPPRAQQGSRTGRRDMPWRVEKRLMRPSQAPTVRARTRRRMPPGGPRRTDTFRTMRVRPRSSRPRPARSARSPPAAARWCWTATACTAGSAPARFGTVWRAHDERLDREVAVKIVPRERVVGGRFEREARAAARLAHPGIVTLYEAGADDEGAYLVSELVRGATLDSAARRGAAVRPRHRRDRGRALRRARRTPTPTASSTATSSRPTCSCPERPTAPRIPPPS